MDLPPHVRIAKGFKEWASLQERIMPKLKERTSSPSEQPFDANRIVVLVEPRAHPSFEFVVRNVRTSLPTLPILVVHGTTNEDFVKGVCANVSSGEGITYLNCRAADLPNRAYNTLFLQKSFWKSIPESFQYALIVQTDCVIMQSSGAALNTLLELEKKGFVYTGAPWNLFCSVCASSLDSGCGHMIDQAVVAGLPNMVGNGGLSYRHLPSVREALEKYSFGVDLTQSLVSLWDKTLSTAPKQIGTTNEDVFFCKCFKDMGLAVADRVSGLEFAIEQIPPLNWPQWHPPLAANETGPVAFGAHKPWAYLHPNTVKSIFDKISL